MYYVVTIATMITMALALTRALLGPTVYDRVLAVNMFGTKTVLLFSVIAFLAGRPDFLDLALAYALINFIGVLAVLEFFRSRASRRAEEQLEADRSVTVRHDGDAG
jgi:multicomponent Na+:H+ antiporter subunit F